MIREKKIKKKESLSHPIKAVLPTLTTSPGQDPFWLWASPSSSEVRL